VYKQIRVVVLLALALTVPGCGSGPRSGHINGFWVATLNNANGSPVYSFSTTFTQGSASTLSITNFTFTVPGPCFESYQGDQYSEAGSFTLSGNSNGNFAGTFGMTISTIFPTTNNVLTLNGTVNGDTISGTWSATGLQGCSGNGKFTIQGLPPV
jgi:hypothetical protein